MSTSTSSERKRCDTLRRIGSGLWTDDGRSLRVGFFSRFAKEKLLLCHDSTGLGSVSEVLVSALIEAQLLLGVHFAGSEVVNAGREALVDHL